MYTKEVKKYYKHNKYSKNCYKIKLKLYIKGDYIILEEIMNILDPRGFPGSIISTVVGGFILAFLTNKLIKGKKSDTQNPETPSNSEEHTKIGNDVNGDFIYKSNVKKRSK